MLGFLISLGLLTCLLWLGFKITGALFAACIWLFISVPLSIAAGLIGVVCCCTIILLPVGLWFLKTGLKLLLPGI